MSKRQRSRSSRKKAVMREYLQAALLGLFAGIIMVFASMAMKVMAAPSSPAAEIQAEEIVVQQKTHLTAEAENGKVKDTETKTESEEVKTEETDPEPKPVIIIDPGHGGVDDGCVFDNIKEKEINKKIAYRVAEKLRKMGYKVELARQGDTYIDKADRVEEANRKSALLYVSIHQNSCEDKSVSGIETWYDGSDTSRDSKRLAQLIQQETVKRTGANDRALVDDSELCVTSKSTMPSCLIETGFLSNETERENLNTIEYRDKIAEGIANGIDLYLNPKTMYLTFDDGPSAESTDKVLDVLKKKNVKATFFVIGEYVRKYPETAKRIVEEGHTIGIHCDVHDYGPLYESVDSYIADFEKAYDTVLEVTGVEAKFFRFPGGSINAYNKEVRDDIIAEMEKRGFIYYDWNSSVEDAARGKKTPEQLIQNAKDTALGRQRVVLLAHDRVDNTAQALEDLIDAFPEYKMELITEDMQPVHFRG